MRSTLERIALVSVLASVPAIAYSQAADPAEDPAAGADPAPAGQTAPATGGTEASIAPVEGQIILQSEDTILAKDMIGLTVFSHEGDPVGDINNLIVNLDGAVEGVVIGVGGFLGIGEKEVAIELNKIKLVTPEGGGMKLVLNATREDLDAAPVFKTARAQKLELDAAGAVQPSGEGLAPAVEPAE
ncbi:PRC-barrel domain-containing protein [Leisingera thetidis]|uniref:PRC-barrel domain-containing protein n=1 Tax=Leisingera thetidis TaxID=2930199 RepID=UPI0021F6C80A|nr:PRC-barrel domain-containing protein [Leisingera thetidis]